MTQPTFRVAWIGTGVMGVSMAGHLLRAGHRLTVHTRTRARAEGLLEAGAAWADDPAAAAAGADVAFSIVGFPEDVEAVHLAPGGTLDADPLPRVIVEMTTSRPRLAERIAEAAAAKGVGAVDAPVSGGDVGAREARLSIMVGGAEADVALVRPLLETLGRHIVHHGGPGAGQHAKMVNQIMIASIMVGVCEGLRYARRAGLDRARVLESVRPGAAGSWTLEHLAPRMIDGDFGPGFFVEHFVKDLGIAIEEAERMELALPGLDLAKRLYDEAVAQGRGRDGTQVLLPVLEQLDAARGPSAAR